MGFGTWLQSVESDWVFLLQGKEVVKPGSGCDLVGYNSCFYFWSSLFMVFWAGILAGFSLSRYCHGGLILNTWQQGIYDLVSEATGIGLLILLVI